MIYKSTYRIKRKYFIMLMKLERSSSQRIIALHDLQSTFAYTVIVIQLTKYCSFTSYSCGTISRKNWNQENSSIREPFHLIVKVARNTTDGMKEMMQPIPFCNRNFLINETSRDIFKHTLINLLINETRCLKTRSRKEGEDGKGLRGRQL